MNDADTVLASGFDELLAIAGDSVTFRGQTVSAIINREPVDHAMDPEAPNFETIATARLEIPKTAVAQTPRVGELITEGTIVHRIARVKDIGLAWSIDCESTP